MKIRTQPRLTKTLVGCLAVLLAPFPALAGAANEAEPNNPIGAAQFVTIPAEGLTIFGVLGKIGTASSKVGDLDFFSFDGEAGDVVTLDVDCGMGSGDCGTAAGGVQSVNTRLALFDADLIVKVQNDDSGCSPCDPGSTSGRDAFIGQYELEKTGRYYIGVGDSGPVATPHEFMDGGLVKNATSTYQYGDYKLVISVVPSVRQVKIKIKPERASDEPAPINPKSHGRIRAAVLSEANFDATAVTPDLTTFGSSGDERSLVSCDKEKDVNDDGRPDLICEFDNQAADFKMDDVKGTLKSKTKDGKRIQGSDAVRIVPKPNR